MKKVTIIQNKIRYFAQIMVALLLIDSKSLFTQEDIVISSPLRINNLMN